MISFLCSFLATLVLLLAIVSSSPRYQVNGATIPFVEAHISSFEESAKLNFATAKAKTAHAFQEASSVLVATGQPVLEFKNAVADVVSSASPFQERLNAAAQKHGVAVHDVSCMLSTSFTNALENLKAEFTETSPTEDVIHFENRTRAISDFLTLVADGVVKAGGVWDVPEADLRASIEEMKPHVQHFLLVSGNLIREHPELVQTIVVFAVLSFATEILPFKVLLRVLGFGRLGPGKGTAAAWAQRNFYGASVGKASWFAQLQFAGMKLVL